MQIKEKVDPFKNINLGKELHVCLSSSMRKERESCKSSQSVRRSDHFRRLRFQRQLLICRRTRVVVEALNVAIVPAHAYIVKSGNREEVAWSSALRRSDITWLCTESAEGKKNKNKLKKKKKRILWTTGLTFPSHQEPPFRQLFVDPFPINQILDDFGIR